MSAPKSSTKRPTDSSSSGVGGVGYDSGPFQGDEHSVRLRRTGLPGRIPPDAAGVTEGCWFILTGTPSFVRLFERLHISHSVDNCLAAGLIGPEHESVSFGLRRIAWIDDHCPRRDCARGTAAVLELHRRIWRRENVFRRQGFATVGSPRSVGDAVLDGFAVGQVDKMKLHAAAQVRRLMPHLGDKVGLDRRRVELLALGSVQLEDRRSWIDAYEHAMPVRGSLSM